MIELQTALGKRQVQAGFTPAQLLQQEPALCEGQIVALAQVDGCSYELHRPILHSARVEFVTLFHVEGRRAYMRSLVFLLLVASEHVFPEAKLYFEHSLSEGYFGRVKGLGALTEEHLQLIGKEMRAMIARKSPLTRCEVARTEAIRRFVKRGYGAKAALLGFKSDPWVHIYELEGVESYFYGYLMPDVSRLALFSLQLYQGGLLLLGPDSENPSIVTSFVQQPKLFEVYRQAEQWAQIAKAPSAAALNTRIQEGSMPQLVQLAEAFHENKICEMAKQMAEQVEKSRILLISGPSSSGKTSFAYRLKMQLMVYGFRPLTLSIDDYFVNRENTPLDARGEKDFEALEAIDLELFNQHLEKLVMGYEVQVPLYDFKSGRRVYLPKRTVRVVQGQPLIIEGIHALNPRLSEAIALGSKTKIYISPLTPLNFDEHNPISTSDVRLIRRLVRDQKNRGYDALETLSRWESVRRGEKSHIFPFQEQADFLFNSSLLYELPVLAGYARPLLESVQSDQTVYNEANRLLKFLQYFLDFKEEKYIAANSLLREFIGGSILF